MELFSNLKEMGWLIDVVTLITVLVGLTFAGLELRQVRMSEESQVLIQFFETMNSSEQIEAFEVVQSLPSDLSASDIQDRLTPKQMQRVLQLRLSFEAMGLMVFRGDISIEWVDELFRYQILQTWDKLEALTIEGRKDTGYAGLMEWYQLRNSQEPHGLPSGLVSF